MRLLNQMIKAMTTSRGHLERLPTFNENENQDILEFLKDYEMNRIHITAIGRIES